MILALEEYFKVNNYSNNLVLTGLTGISASKINGSTIHLVCKITPFNNAIDETSENSLHLIDFWQDLEYLIIDEVSMMSLFFLAQLHKKFCIAKKNDKLLGVVHILFVRDSAQLPPVKGSPFYKKTRAELNLLLTNTQT